jgi:hypothetical protein
MKYYLKKIDTSFHQCLPNMIQRLFADVITWRDLVYEYSWGKSPMISGYDLLPIVWFQGSSPSGIGDLGWILSILFRPFGFIAPKTFDFERHLMKVILEKASCALHSISTFLFVMMYWLLTPPRHKYNNYHSYIHINLIVNNFRILEYSNIATNIRQIVHKLWWQLNSYRYWM